MICLSTMAVVCLLTVVMMLMLQPRWQTPLLGLPLCGYLLGGLGGLLTLACSPSWARRVGRDWRIVTFTVYRLASAFALGGVGLALASAAAAHGTSGGWSVLAASLGAGIAEKPINDGVLKVIGVLAPPEGGSRLI